MSQSFQKLQGKYFIFYGRIEPKKGVIFMAKKVVLVTGASRGIGKAIAVKFAKKGYNVIINCAHREQELMQTKKKSKAIR